MLDEMAKCPVQLTAWGTFVEPLSGQLIPHKLHILWVAFPCRIRRLPIIASRGIFSTLSVLRMKRKRSDIKMMIKRPVKQRTGVGARKQNAEEHTYAENMSVDRMNNS